MGKKILSNIDTLLICFLIFIMIVFPMAIDLLFFKFYLFVAIIGITVIKNIILNGPIRISKKVFSICLFYIVLSALFVLYGLSMDNVGASKMAQLYLLWPTVYLYCFLSLKEKDYKKITKTIVIAFVFIGLYGINMVMYYNGMVAFPYIYYNFGFEHAISFENSFYELRYEGINSIAYGIGFILGFSYLNFREKKNIMKTAIILVIFSIVIFISGRRIYMILFPLSIFIYAYYYARKNRHKYMYFLLTILAFIMLILFVNFTIENFFSNIIQILRIDGNDERIIQLSKLISEWLKNPLTFFIGSGHGAVHPTYIRSLSNPWSYELFYISLLFQTGIVGFIGYTYFYVSVVKIMIKTIRLNKSNKDLLPYAMGTITLLIANFTNPYLLRFDNLWILFLPLCYVNALYINKKENYLDEKA